MSNPEIEYRDVPGIGFVTALIASRKKADGTVFLRMLKEARTEDGRPVSNEDLPDVKAAFHAY